MQSVRLAIYGAISLGVALYVREAVRAFVIVRQGDLLPKLHGRLPPKPKAMFDPFGTLLLPILLLFVLAVTGSGIPFAYAKPLPRDEGRFESRRRVVLAALAGPAANAACTAIAGLALRAGMTGEVQSALEMFLIVNAFMAVFQLMPIPGLDGAEIIALSLDREVRTAYLNAGRYLALFMLLVFFMLVTLVMPLALALMEYLCRLLAGRSC
ncbi:MAG: hypothetical protein WD050_09885 [Actinomycetota bacterium]